MTNMLNASDMEKAVEALKECIEKTKQKQEVRQLIDEERVAMQFSFKKFVTDKHQTIKIFLPHPPERKACLFVKDVERKSRDFLKTKCAYEDILKEYGLEDVTIIPLKDLKINYTNYESKISLSDMYEVFLADARIIRLIPAFLGSAFQKRKRYLVQVHLDSKILKKEFQKALSMTHCILSGRGSCSQVVVGHIDQESKFLAKNILDCFMAIQKEVPGGLQNIRNVQIKCGDSLAVPLYVSYGSKEDVVLPEVQHAQGNDEEDAEDVATVLEGKVLIKNGSIEIIKPGGKKQKSGKRLDPAAKRFRKSS